MSDNRVRIFDTTLRDGEQSPGATLTAAEKLKIAGGLARMGVDVIEAGFPAASTGDLIAVRQIADSVGQLGGEATPSGQPPIICGLARAKKSDIDAAWKAVRGATRGRIHTFLATSEIHMEHKLRMSRQQVLDQVGEMVAYAREKCVDVEFSPEDAARSDPEFLFQVLARAIDAGATTLNIPDTVGVAAPNEFGELIADIIKHTPGIETCIVSTHCHNDLGLAVANSLAGVMAGARQVEVAVNGIGERAGNTSLEEIVMALHVRGAYYGVDTGVDTTQIMRLSKLVSASTGIHVQPNKAIVGANAFAHEAGIHQDGMLKHHATYEIMRPETVGAAKSVLVLGKHSGRHAFRVRLAELGHSIAGDDLVRSFERFKELADKKKTITDADLEALVADELYQPEEVFSLLDLQVSCGMAGMPTATVKMRGPEGAETVRAAVGAGPVDAAYRAIAEITRHRAALLEFTVQSVTRGIDALGEVTVKLESAERQRNPQSGARQAKAYLGHGADTDIVVASAKAYVSALNKAMVATRATVGPAEARA